LSTGERERESDWLREKDGTGGFTCRRERENSRSVSRGKEREKNERQSKNF